MIPTIKKFIKTGSDVSIPLYLWDVNPETKERTAVDIQAENLSITCSFFDHKNKELSRATIEPMAGVINGLYLTVPAAETQTWTICKDARFDLLVHSTITGKKKHTSTEYFDIERGLTQWVVI